MREIKFRGKCVDNGEWAYGYLFVSQMSGAYILSSKINVARGSSVRMSDSLIQSEINPDTIGQYTGLKDKNGTEIYEGDIVELVNTYKGMNTKAVAEIAFCDWTFACKWADEDAPNGYMYNPLGSYNFPIVTIKVIGNIFDNPEILGGEANA